MDASPASESPSAAAPPRLHLVGVAGSGMKAVAEVLSDAGWTLSGSDLSLPDGVVQSLARRGVALHLGHGGDHLPADVAGLIYSPAIPEENAERRMARARNVPQWSYPQMLARLMEGRMGVAVAGTHGKSTTTALVGWMLRHSGRAPTLVCGAELLNCGASGVSGSGPHVVVEACEYRRHFLELTPRIAVVLGIEADHFDYFSGLDDTIGAFREFVARTPPDGLIVCRGDCEATRRAVADAVARVTTFSLAPGSSAEWRAEEIQQEGFGWRFTVVRRGREFLRARLPIPGRHHVGNVLAATAVAEACGLAPGEITAALAEFRGIRRRFEVLGEFHGVTLIDDYAHHPTAVAATIATVRETFPGRRVWAALQPHQVSRTQALLEEFASSVAGADEVLIAPVFTAREGVQAAVSAARELTRRAALRGVSATFVPSLDHVAATLQTDVRRGDVFLTMGAGDIDRVHYEFTGRLQRHHAS